MKRRGIAIIVAGVTMTVGLSAPAQVTSASEVLTSSRVTLDWHDCGATLDGWECGTLTVPRDWFDRSNPQTFGIEFAVHRASGHRVGSLTMNPGGPGGPSLEVAEMLMGSTPARIKRHFDVVLWDPRGVGRSGPFLANCPLPPQMADLPATGPVDWEEIVPPYLAANAEANRACLEANADLAPYLGTQYVVRDLEALRGALGIEKWTYWGMSYGTRIGLLYAQLYPTRVRALLLDGSVAPNDSISQIAAGMGATQAQTLTVLASLMGKGAASRLTRVIRALNHRTYTDEMGTVVTRWDFLFGLLLAARDNDTLPDAIRMINEAFGALFGTRERRLETTSPLREPDYGRLYTLRFVNCADYGDRPTSTQVSEWAASSSVTGTAWAGHLTSQVPAWCAGLPAFPHPMPRVTRPLRLPQPPVVLNSRGDPGTPWLWARQMATAFRGSSLITYEGTAHVIYGGTRSRCVNAPVTAYLLRLERPGNRVCGFVPGRG